MASAAPDTDGSTIVSSIAHASHINVKSSSQGAISAIAMRTCERQQREHEPCKPQLAVERPHGRREQAPASASRPGPAGTLEREEARAVVIRRGPDGDAEEDEQRGADDLVARIVGRTGRRLRRHRVARQLR